MLAYAIFIYTFLDTALLRYDFKMRIDHQKTQYCFLFERKYHY